LPLDLRSQQAAEGLFHEIRRQRAFDCCSRVHGESGLERADAGARGGDPTVEHFCSGGMRVLERGTELARCSDHTLQTTALVNEAYLRLADQPLSGNPM
jgi:hypothetical protein